jgi:hypothetical protein
MIFSRVGQDLGSDQNIFSLVLSWLVGACKAHLPSYEAQPHLCAHTPKGHIIMGYLLPSSDKILSAISFSISSLRRTISSYWNKLWTLCSIKIEVKSVAF